VQRLNPSAESLYVFYGNDKKRADTYKEMVDRIVECVTGGDIVCAVFYGHPGIFCYPPHEAIRLLRQDGFDAKMLPAVSSLDCLFSDLGVDPAMGCQIFEATDLVLRNRYVDVASKVIIWQIACVGDFGFNFNGYDKRNLPVLVELLQGYYGVDYVVTLYEASQYPVCEPVILEVPLSKVMQAPVTAITTMYIPPKSTAPLVGEMVRRVGLWDYLKDKVASEETIVKNDTNVAPLAVAHKSICS
jgi:uncharacterized protein YabN with tetrapyrrole methylase and pyrophosphatase domain